jgi:hypothetical protein
MVHRSFTDDLYHAKYNIYIGEIDNLKNTIKRKFNIDLDDKQSSGSFFSIKNDNGEEHLLIWLDKWNIYNLLHEIVHAVVYVLEQRGVKIDSENDEAFCYYVGWVFEKSIKLLR